MTNASPVLAAGWRIIFALVYALLYNFIYEIYLFPLFEYFGFRNYESRWTVIGLGIAAVCLGSAVLPRKISLPSDFCSWMLFVLIYVPSVVTISKSGTLKEGHVEALIVCLCVSQITLTLIPRVIKFQEIYLGGLRAIANPIGLSVVSIIVSLVLTARFYGVMSLAGFDEIYIQRETAAVGDAGLIFGYLILWQTYALAPLLIAAAFYTRRKIYLLPPLLGLTVIYLITAAKIALFIYVTIFFVYLLNRWGGFRRASMFMLIAIIPLALAAIIFVMLGSRLEGPLMVGTSVIIMRGIAVQGMLTNLYAEFFSFHPFTYFSHVNVIGLIVDYPYEAPLSTELSYYLIGHGNAGANASFWATDGIAAAGNIGVVLIGIIAGLLFAVVNAFMVRVDTVFSALALSPFVMALANVSMFTSLLSAGGFIVFLLAAPLYDRLHQDVGGIGTGPYPLAPPQ